MQQEGAMEAEKKATISGSRRTSSSGGEAVAVLKSQKLADGDKGESGKGMRPVSQKYIDMLLKEKATSTGAYRVSRSMEFVEKYKSPHDFRALVARSNACMEKVRAEDAKILEQYELLGCAYTDAKEVSVIDEEKVRRYLPRWRLAA